ncbi:TetR/AcrR family transcriptional regulator [Solimonas marina]|nr:TetR/AcrR family transcriptional regulator [Solimonas marina]
MGRKEGGSAPLRVRDRIFAAAGELFREHGIRAVGVDAIATRAGTNKVSFYRSFASKDALVVECLQAREADYWRWWEAVVAPYQDAPRAQIEALFASAAACRGHDGVWAGSAFSHTAVELRDTPHPAHALIAAHKAEVRRRLTALAAAAGARDPQALGDALLLLLDGGASLHLLFGDSGCDAPLAGVTGSVRALLDAQLAAPGGD